MKKRYVALLVTLGVASFLCFRTQSLEAYGEWALFLTLFAMAIFFQRLAGRKKKKAPPALIEKLQEGVVFLDWEGKVIDLNAQGAYFLRGEKSKFLGSLLFNHPILKNYYVVFHRIRETLIDRSFLISAEKQSFEVHLKIIEPKKVLMMTLLDRSGQYQKEQLGKDFVANASHELRTPITIIKGFAETIYDLPTISEAMLTDFSEKIVRNCERMDNLVKNLLTLADLDYLPKARLQECDLVGMIDNCSHSLLSLYPDVELESLHNSEYILVNGDPDLLELAIMNLLENGVKYSSEVPKIQVTIEEHGEEVCLTIADQGIGIPCDDLDHIFERFYTVNKAHSRRLGGAGLGLSIVKTIASKHEATVCVESKEGEGTAFTLCFQKKEAPVPL